MKEITSEYLEILNTYIKIKEIDGKIYTKLTEPNELRIILDSFWTTEYDKLVKKIENFDGIKTINHGLVPENIESILKRSSLYSDMILLEAPLDSVILKSNLNNEENSKRLLRVIGYKLSKINEIEDWIDEGIVTLLPPILNQKQEQYSKVMETLIEEDLKNNNIAHILDNEYNEICKIEPGYIKPDKDITYFGALSKLNDDLIKSGSLNAIFSTQFEFYWNLLKCKLEKEETILGKDCISLAALNSANVKFLENVTLDFALKIRKEGSLSELRSYFRETFKDIQKTPDESEFYALVQNYSIEINDQIKKHEREWENIKKDAFENIGVKGSLAISTGSIGGITTFGLGIPAWIGFLGGVLISSNYTIRDIVDEFLEFRRKRRDLHKNPIHLLYELKTS